MSLLEQQLQELQSKKLKVDLFKSLLKEFGASPSFNNIEVAVAEPVLEELTEFINNRISAIENGTPLEVPTDGGVFSEDEVSVLKEIAARTLDRMNNPPAPERPPVRRPTPVSNSGTFADDDAEWEEPRRPQRKPQTPPRPQKQASQDVIAFAQAHRHLDGKTCTIPGRNGEEIQGKIVGTQVPYLVVQTVTGHTLNILPENVTVG